VDSATVFGNWNAQRRWRYRVAAVPVDWQVQASQVLMKNHLMVLDLLATNNWQRPIYFAVTTGPDSYINLQELLPTGRTHLPRGACAFTENREPESAGTRRHGCHVPVT
jgi:hypothetical protein